MKKYLVIGLSLVSVNAFANAVSDQAISLGKSAEGSNNYKKAVQYYRKALAFPESQDPATIGLSHSLIELGEFDEAQQLLSNYITTINPFNVEAHYMLSDLYFKRGQYAEALKSTETADSLQPGNSRALEQTACLLHQLTIKISRFLGHVTRALKLVTSLKPAQAPTQLGPQLRRRLWRELQHLLLQQV